MAKARTGKGLEALKEIETGAANADRAAEMETATETANADRAAETATQPATGTALVPVAPVAPEKTPEETEAEKVKAGEQKVAKKFVAEYNALNRRATASTLTALIAAEQSAFETQSKILNVALDAVFVSGEKLRRAWKDTNEDLEVAKKSFVSTWRTMLQVAVYNGFSVYRGEEAEAAAIRIGNIEATTQEAFNRKAAKARGYFDEFKGSKPVDSVERAGKVARAIFKDLATNEPDTIRGFPDFSGLDPETERERMEAAKEVFRKVIAARYGATLYAVEATLDALKAGSKQPDPAKPFAKARKEIEESTDLAALQALAADLKKRIESLETTMRVAASATGMEAPVFTPPV